MKLVNEECEDIQEILKNNDSIDEKALQIECYYRSKIIRHRIRGRAQEPPAMHFMQIKKELEKRGENPAAIDIEL